MISPDAISQTSPLSSVGAAAWNIGLAPLIAADRLARIKQVATWCGWQEDGNGGGFELWNLRVPLGAGAYPAGSTVSRQTIERFLFGGGSAELWGKYGAGVVGMAEDFGHVEKASP